MRKRALAIMLLSYDEDLEETLEIDSQTLGQIHRIRDGVQKEYGHPLSYVIAKKRSNYVNDLLKGIVSYREHEEKGRRDITKCIFFLFNASVCFLCWIQDYGPVDVHGRGLSGYKRTNSMDIEVGRWWSICWFLFILPVFKRVQVEPEDNQHFGYFNYASCPRLANVNYGFMVHLQNCGAVWCG